MEDFIDGRLTKEGSNCDHMYTIYYGYIFKYKASLAKLGSCLLESYILKQDKIILCFLTVEFYLYIYFWNKTLIYLASTIREISRY